MKSDNWFSIFFTDFFSKAISDIYCSCNNNKFEIIPGFIRKNNFSNTQKILIICKNCYEFTEQDVSQQFKNICKNKMRK